MRSKFLSLEEAYPSLTEVASAGSNYRDRRTAAAVLEMGLRRLTPRQRECVQMYYYRSFTLEEIAQALGVNPSTVCRHLQKARAHLREFAKIARDLHDCWAYGKKEED